MPPCLTPEPLRPFSLGGSLLVAFPPVVICPAGFTGSVIVNGNAYLIIIVIVVAVMASALTFLLYRLLDRLRRRDAESEAREIVRKSQREVENRRREAELEIKETALQAAGRKREGAAPAPRRAARTRTAAGQTSGRPGGAGRAAPQAGEDRRKHPAQADRADPGHQPPQGRAFQAAGPAAADAARAQRAEPARRPPRGCWRSSTTQLQQETGAVILKHEKQLAETCEAEDPRGAADLACSATPPPTRPRPPPARSTSPTTR